MRSRLTSTHFVGRVGELSELLLAVREASAGRSALVLLGGDSGVGKTRLVGELEQRLATSGDEPPALVLRGEGVQQSDGELPYAPLLSALRPLVRGRHPALEALSAGSRAQLGSILPGIAASGATDETHDPASGQLRLFEAVLELIDLLSQPAPVVLILEDMHWADRSTRSFVAFLSRSLRQERLVLLLTYRTDELHRRHALRPLLAELDRLERARRIELEPFDRAELREALADILGAEPDKHLVERLYARSEGNPLYTEELLAAGLDGRGAAPQSLRDAFIGRIERLSDPAQQAARAVAVGRALSEQTIATVTGGDRDNTQTALREALAEQVLITDQDERFCFRHALLREALYDDLLPGERGEWHLALALALEEKDSTGDRELERATTIASHYAAAGDQPAALRASVHAAQFAGRVHAYGEVSELVERALELWPRVSEDARPTGVDHVDLLAMAARAYGISGQWPRSEVLFRRALDEVDPDSDPLRYASLLSRLARIQRALNRAPEAIETAERALAMLADQEGARERASLLAWLGRTRWLRGRYRDAIADAEVALAAAIEAGDRSAEGEVLNTLGMAEIMLGELPKGVARLRQAIEIAREVDDVDGIATAYGNLADLLGLSGRTREALEVAQEGLELTPKRFIRSYDWIEMTVSDVAFRAGDWELSRSSLCQSAARMSGVAFMFRQLRGAELALGEGEDEIAESCLDSVENLIRESTEPQWIALHGVLVSELGRRRGDYGAARAAVENALDRIEVCTDDIKRIARISAAGVRVEADRAQRARDLAERAELRDALARARLHVGRLEAAAGEGGPVERAYMAEGKAEMARARGRGGAPQWAKAATAWEDVDRPYEAASARWREAEALVSAGERAPAAAAAGRALQTATELGSKWLSDEIRVLAERGRLELDGARASNGSAVTAAPEPQDPFGLTPRERQVLALVAQGATNRQIGAALFMAEKTASVHVSRILSKLGVSGRTQAAAIAHRQHLA
ncbi:MAG TPA: AAA family ATPase [Solirubrobacteraceae bacterium]|nr:AAA family ATPase [Solirubrobacteraceae bacterium]